MSDLFTVIPVTAIVAISLFSIKEFIEASRRRAADSRKLQAIKKVLAKDLEFNYSSILNLKNFLLKISVTELSESASEITITEDHKSTGFIVEFVEFAYVQQGFRCENIQKHLVEAAVLNESFYQKCDSALEGLSAAKHVHHSLVFGPPKHFPSTNKNYYEGLAGYGLEELETSIDVIKEFYKECTGNVLSCTRHQWAT